MSISRKVLQAAAAKERHEKRINQGIEAGWRLIDATKECFLLRPRPTDECFMRFKKRNPQQLVNIFQDFVTPTVLDGMIADAVGDSAGILVGSRPSRVPGNAKLARYYQPTRKSVWQKMCVEIRITGIQKQKNEAHAGTALLKDSVAEAIAHFKTIDPHFISQRQFEYMSQIMINDRILDMLCKNFASVVAAWGESIAGDEKLFHFTGDHGTVRLVASKPGRVGQWMYELCAMTSTGHPFLVWTKMHDNSDGEKVTIASIVKEWMDAIALGVVDGCELLPMLAMDSYYMGADSRKVAVDNKQPFSCSCKRDRVAVEIETLEYLYLKDKGKKMEVGPDEYVAMYNEKTKEVFCVAHDSQKGIGIKYNLTNGLVHCTNKHVVKKNKSVIPGYSYYKWMFEVCDRFNRNLHDRSYPHSRGGKGRGGAYANAHDFDMSALLQNTFSCYDHLMEVHDRVPTDWTFQPDDVRPVDPRRTRNFCEKCIALSDQMAKVGYDTVLNIEMVRSRPSAPADPLAAPAFLPARAECTADEYDAAAAELAVAPVPEQQPVVVCNLLLVPSVVGDVTDAAAEPATVDLSVVSVEQDVLDDLSDVPPAPAPAEVPSPAAEVPSSRVRKPSSMHGDIRGGKYSKTTNI